MLAKDEQEFIQRHREEFRALIDESRMELAWKERARELKGWTTDLDSEFGLLSGTINEFLVREYRPMFEALWTCQGSPDCSLVNEPAWLNAVQRRFKSALDAEFPSRLVNRLFYAFAWDQSYALNPHQVSDEQVARNVASFR